MTQKYEPVAASGLDESFIATATAVGSPTAIAQPYLEVVAPATLPEVSTIVKLHLILCLRLYAGVRDILQSSRLTELNRLHTCHTGIHI